MMIRTIISRQSGKASRLMMRRSLSSVKVVEVGPRDGLQNETTIVSTEDKLTLIRSLAEAGLSSIEATSFVSPKAIPALADAKEVMRGIEEVKRSQFGDTKFSVLIPNAKYFNLAMDCTSSAIDEIAIFGSASETFSQKNIRCSIDESLERFRSVVDLANKGSNTIPIRGYVSCVLGCPYEGTIDPKMVAHLTERLLELGCHEVSLGDTIGVGTPGSTRTLLEEVIPAVGGSNPLAVHFHDTYGQALANILVSLERDISVVDASVAGLGGCPYAGGSASGNVATEDVVYMLNGLGVETGIDLDKLVDTGRFICNVLGRETTSKAAAAILSKRKRGH